MADATNKSLVRSVNSWPLSRKLSLVAATVICAAIFAVIILQAQVADYNLLFAHMDNADAAEVVEWLKERKIPYRIESNGTSIYIPADKVYESRIELAGSGLPRGGGVGFEIFDKQSFGMTDFAQKVNYRRALQGELMRTITSLGPVEGARIHLALPEKRLFREQQQQATASVIVKLVSGSSLKEAQLQGIVHLVAGSVEGLEAENVTVVDSSGKVLSKSRSDEVAGPMTPGMLEYQQTMERLTRFVEFVQSGPENPRWLDHFQEFWETGNVVNCSECQSLHLSNGPEQADDTMDTDDRDPDGEGANRE